MYKKETGISGKDEDGEFKFSIFHGHWKKDGCINKAKKMKLTEPFDVTHYVSDTSGSGRGGKDVYKMKYDGSYEQVHADNWGGGNRKADF